MTATDVVLASSPDDIASLPAEQRGQMITHALIESKQWLTVATKGTDPTPIAEFKAWAATVAEMTKQKGLAAEIQADALEMVRRAERGIAVSVRAGQAAGEIRTVGQRGPSQTAYERVRNGKVEVFDEVVREQQSTIRSPSEFFANSDEWADANVMADGVSDEHFEQALMDARDEGNLTRASVVRHVKGVKPERLTPAERLNMIGDMADAGHTSDQIAKAVGHTEEYVRRLAKENGIDIRADKIMRGTRRIDYSRAVQATVDSLAALAAGLDQIDVTRVDADQIENWAASMKESLAALNKLRNNLLKETTQ